MRIVLVLFVLFFSLSATGQGNPRVDSVLREIKDMKVDTAKVNMYRLLFYDFQGDCNVLFYPGEDVDEKMKYIDSILVISQRLNSRYGIATAYNCKGLVYLNQQPGHYKKALDNFTLARDIFAVTGNRSSSAGVLCNIGTVYQAQFKSDAAMSVLSIAKKIQEEMHDSLALGATLFDIGKVYLGWRDYDKAMDNFLMAKTIFEIKREQRSLALTYSNLGWTFARQKRYSDALAAANKGLGIATQTGWTPAIRDANECLKYVAKHSSP